MTIARASWCWDRVWIGCGASKRAARSPALELYTGPVFAAHLAIASHLNHVPDVMSAEHGVVPWVAEVDPYDTVLSTIASRARFSALVLHEVQRLLEEVARLRARRDDDDAGLPPSILVLAGAPYIDGWAGQARAMGVRIDDPLRGYQLGERRAFARRFCDETPSWRDVSAWTETEASPGWGTRREQLLAFVDQVDLERVGGVDEVPLSEPMAQLGLFAEAAQ